MMARLLRNAVNSFIPNWLANRPGLNTGFKVLYTGALVADCLIETGWQGLLAGFPGVGTPTAIPLLAQSRGLLQGPNEPDASFIARLIGWLSAWEQAGSDEQLALQIQAFLTGAGTLGAGVLPTVRIVDRSGTWVIANPDGSITTTSAAWDWDGVTGWVDDVGFKGGPFVANYWSDLWIIVAPDPFPRYTGTSDPAWLSSAGQATGRPEGGLGHNVPQEYVDGVLSLVATWKGAHVWVRSIIWAGDSNTTFVPTNPTADGTFGNAAKVVAGRGLPARASSARYWDLQGGG